MGRTTELRRELKRRFYPLAEERGFVVDPGTGPVGVDFRRITPEHVDVFDLQWDKYGRPRFVLNFGRCAGAGVVHLGEHFPPEKVLAYMGPELGQLRPGSGPGPASWFRQDPPWLKRLFLRRADRPPAEVVDLLLALFPEVEAWFRDGRVGPHLHLTPSPFRPRQP